MKFKTCVHISILCCLLLTLTACKPLLDVRLFSSDERLPTPRFVVEDPSQPGQRPLYDTIKLAEAGGQLYWHLRAEPFGYDHSVAEFAYGRPLSGFIAVQPAKSLEPNHDYTLFVSGKAYGTLRFRVDGAGAVHVIR